MEPGAGPSQSGMLDSAPPQPPGSQKRASLMDNQRAQGGQQSGNGLGADGANPQILALQGLAMMEQGTQLLSSALPALAQPLMGLMQNLKQVIPQAMADQVSGTDTNAGVAGAPSAPPQAQAAPPQPQQPQMGAPAGA